MEVITYIIINYEAKHTKAYVPVIHQNRHVTEDTRMTNNHVQFLKFHMKRQPSHRNWVLLRMALCSLGWQASFVLPVRITTDWVAHNQQRCFGPGFWRVGSLGQGPSPCNFLWQRWKGKSWRGREQEQPGRKGRVGQLSPKAFYKCVTVQDESKVLPAQSPHKGFGCDC